MGDWTSGYVADVEYVSGFHREQSPAFSSFVALLNGYAPLRLPDGYTYCELGCGQAMTVATLAAADPRGRFWGIDFNPAHIVNARDLTADVGIDNLTLKDASFSDMLADLDSYPEFDVVTLHGVYSWVTPEIRREIVQFLQAKVKPGGHVYVSYNSQPGWNGCVPVQRLIHEYGRRLPGASTGQVMGAIGFAEKLAEIGASQLSKDDKFLEQIVKTAKQADVAYLAHEYMNACWTPLFHYEVVQELAEAKLGFVGSANLFDNFPDLCLKAEHKEVINQIEDPVLRETVRDYCQLKLLRRDVFVRGPRRISRAEVDERLAAMRLALVIPLDETTTTIRAPLGEAEMSRETYEPIFAALAEGPKTIGELLALPEVAAKSTAQAVEVAGMLIATRQAYPVDDAEPPAVTPAIQGYNRNLVRRMGYAPTNTRVGLAASLLRTGTLVDGFDCMMLRAYDDGMTEPEPLAEALRLALEARGEKLLHYGKPVEDPEERDRQLMRRSTTFLEKQQPLLRSLGAR